ncbi:hypothetical protein [Oceaniferula marina]|nr:hypothetical protein [Oceaniferula marina]
MPSKLGEEPVTALIPDLYPVGTIAFIPRLGLRNQQMVIVE